MGKRKRMRHNEGGKAYLISYIRGGGINFLFKLGSIISQKFGRHNGSKTYATRHIITFCHPDV